MKRLLPVLVVLLGLVGFSQAQLAGTVVVTGSNVVDSTGTPLVSGTAYFAPTDVRGNPISYRIGTSGQSLSRAVSTTVTNGHFSLRLPDTSVTSPANVCFAASLIDNASGDNVWAGYGCVQPISGTNTWCSSGTCNFDLYPPNLAAIALVQTGPVGPQGPTGCVLGVSCTSSLTPQSMNGELNEEVFTGVSVGARVNAAVTSCGSAQCFIVIPPNAPTGTGWTVPLPGNVTLHDRRVVNGIGFASNTAPHLRAGDLFVTQQGTNLAYESFTDGAGTFTMDFESHAYAGGTAADQTSANSGALLLYSDRTAGNRPIWGMDLNFQYSNQNNTAYGFEIDSVNLSATDDPGAGNVGVGEVIIASGPKKNGIGLLVQGSSQTFRNDIVLRNYDQTGIQFQSGVAHTADIYIVPFANDTSLSLVGRNAANAANVWSMDNSGNLISNSVSAMVLSASSNITTVNETATGTISTANMVVTGVIDSPLYRSGGTNGFNGTCAPATTLTVKFGIVTGCI